MNIDAGRQLAIYMTERMKTSSAVRRPNLVSVKIAVILFLLANPGWPGSRVVLDTVQDSEMAVVLAENFTLPLLIDADRLADTDLAIQIEAEAEKLVSLSQAYGYLDARIEILGDGSDDGLIRLEPKLGLQYRIGWVQVAGLPNGGPAGLSQRLKGLSSKFVGKVASREVLRNLQNSIIHELQEASFARAEPLHSGLVTEPATRTAGFRLSIDPGVAMVFGHVRFNGSVRLTDIKARRIVPFQIGDPFSQTALDALYGALDDTGLFRWIHIRLSDEMNAAGQLDVFVELGDNANDPAALNKGRGVGPALIVAAIVMLALRETARLTPLWNNRTLSWSLRVISLVLAAVAVIVIVQRLSSFLPI